MKQLPLYQCHKVVRAAKVVGVVGGAIQGEPQVEGPSTILLLDVEGSWQPVTITPEWFSKHNPRVGGYYVVYDDGYASWSPADAFESGYKRVPQEAH